MNLFPNSTKFILEYFYPTLTLLMIKVNRFPGDLTDVSAKTKSLVGLTPVILFLKLNMLFLGYLDL